METTETNPKTDAKVSELPNNAKASDAKREADLAKAMNAASNQRPVEVESLNAQVERGGLAGEYARMDRRYKLEIRRDALAFAISLANGTRPEAEKVVATATVFAEFLAKED